jgi:hypothetical protein
MNEWNDLMKEIKREIEASGLADDLNRLYEQYRNEREAVQKDLEQPCLIEGFFKRQAKLPPHRRAHSCMISCPCPRCSPKML